MMNDKGKIMNFSINKNDKEKLLKVLNVTEKLLNVYCEKNKFLELLSCSKHLKLTIWME